MKVVKLDMEMVRKNLKERLASQGREAFLAEMRQLQAAIFVAVGGGFLGKQYAEQPKDAYTDGRVGKLPYPGKAVESMQAVLIAYAEVAGLDPRNLPGRYADFHNCGVW